MRSKRRRRKDKASGTLDLDDDDCLTDQDANSQYRGTSSNSLDYQGSASKTRSPPVYRQTKKKMMPAKKNLDLDIADVDSEKEVEKIVKKKDPSPEAVIPINLKEK